MTTALLRRPARHDGRSRTPAQPTAPEPWIPWRPHAHNPRPTPAAPDPNLDYWQTRSRPPVPWPTQCRDCWGFVDDLRHLAFPVASTSLTDQVTHH